MPTTDRAHGRRAWALPIGVTIGLVALVLAVAPPAAAADYDASVAAGGNAPPGTGEPAPSGEVVGYIDAVTVDSADRLWFVDRYNQRILRFGVGSTTDSPAECTLSSDSFSVNDIAVDSADRLYYSLGNDVVVHDTSVCPATPSPVTTFVVPTSRPELAPSDEGLYYTQADGVHFVPFGPGGDLALVPDPGGSGDLVPDDQLVVPSSGQPDDVVVGLDGDLYVISDSGNPWRFDPADLPVADDGGGGYTAGTLLWQDSPPSLQSLAADADGNVFLRTGGDDGVVRFPPGAAPTSAPSSYCAELTPAELADTPCIVINFASIEAARTAGELDVVQTDVTAPTGGGKVDVDAAGNLFVQAGSSFSDNAQNLVFRVEGTGTPVVARPVLVPGSVGVTEGDAGSQLVDVPITMSTPAAEVVTVDWEVFDVPGNPLVGHPGEDLVAASGTLSFQPGETVAHAQVEVLGDLVDEPPLLWGEWGFVRFLNPSPNADLDVSFFGLGIVVIVDDDPTPTIAPGVASVTEGDAGSVLVEVPVTLSNPSAETITVDWSTIDTGGSGIATSGVDFVAGAGTVTFAPGETSTTVGVEVLGDTEVEPGKFLGEWVLVQFTNPSANSTLDLSLYGLGIGIVVDDD